MIHTFAPLEQQGRLSRARIIEGGAPELLHRLAQVYIGPGTPFPPMPDPPPGFVTWISVDRVAGQGPWSDGD